MGGNSSAKHAGRDAAEVADGRYLYALFILNGWGRRQGQWYYGDGTGIYGNVSDRMRYLVKAGAPCRKRICLLGN